MTVRPFVINGRKTHLVEIEELHQVEGYLLAEPALVLSQHTLCGVSLYPWYTSASRAGFTAMTGPNGCRKCHNAYQKLLEGAGNDSE